MVRAGEPPIEPSASVDFDPARTAGARRDRRAREGASAQSSNGLGFDGRRRRRSTVPSWRPRHRRPGRPGRGSHPHPRLRRRSSSTPLAAADGRRAADRDPRAADRAAGAPRRGRARARRGGDLELHRRGRGRAVRRRRLVAGQPDQRGHEGDAPLAAARADRRGPPQPRPRRGEVRLFEIGRRYLAEGERPTLALVLAGDKRPRDWQTGKARGFDAFDAKAEALALLDAAGAPVDNLQSCSRCRADLAPGPLGHARPRAEDDARRVRRVAPAA